MISLLSYNVLGHLKWKYSCMAEHKYVTMEDVLGRTTKASPASSQNYNFQSFLESIYGRFSDNCLNLLFGILLPIFHSYIFEISNAKY